ncbi:MAG: long-chain fatty acid--CoA ligase [Proteobacteria bacterium]|nr:long-chain fatty acid--CoA ligase [Pseudomonadota bacterium]MDA1057229.1 long-chain fatty acid--CoA ligase [Pseudomonadota bacterium]
MQWAKIYPAGVKWDAELPAKPLFEIFDDSMSRYGDRPCLDFLNKKYTYREVGRMIDHAAAGFQKLGVKKGIKVGLFLPNCPQHVVCYYGILKAGGTVVNFSPLYSEPELLHQIEDSQTDIMVTLNLTLLYPKMKAMLEQSRLKTLIVGTLPEVLPFPQSLLFPLVKAKDVAKVPDDARHVSFKELLNNDGTFAPPEIDPRTDIAVLQYTGGTTGVAKGAMLTHANLYANAVQAAMWFTIAEPGQDRMLSVLPFFHVFAMTICMNMSFYIGAEVIMLPRFELVPVLKVIAKKKPTMLPGVPTMYTAINNYPDLAKYDLTSIKGCISGAAPMPLEVRQRFESLTGCSLVEGYGLTEAAPVVCCNPLEGENKENSVGLPMPGTKVVITDRDDPHKVLAQGEVGEICIEGPQVMLGYWNRPDATAETTIDGRLHTGDVGYMDEDGYTFIIDRIKDLILVGGFNVYPRNVEEGIYKHPAVEEVTVIGVPDEYQGQSVKAFVKLKKGQTLGADQLAAFLREHIGKHEIPRHIEFRNELPKTMVGKLSKKELVQEEKVKAEAKATTAGAQST